MADPVTVVIDQNTIKFTPEGKVDVVDAIASLSGNEKAAAETLWRRIQADHPEASDLFETSRFSGRTKTPVADGPGWLAIQALLIDYLLEDRVKQ